MTLEFKNKQEVIDFINALDNFGLIIYDGSILSEKLSEYDLDEESEESDQK